MTYYFTGLIQIEQISKNDFFLILRINWGYFPLQTTL
jgi:hypothetical protein